MAEREERYEVDFPVFLSWQAGREVRRIAARCLNLSATGALLETRDRLEAGTTVLVLSEHFGRMGMACVRHCTRNLLKYEVGLRFGSVFALSDQARRRILDGVIRTRQEVIEAAEAAEASDAQYTVLPKQFI